MKWSGPSTGSRLFRAIATRYDKKAYVFHATVTVAAIRLWLGPELQSDTIRCAVS